MMWMNRKFIETVSLLFYTCTAVHVSDLLFSAGGSSAITSKGVLNIICAANCLKLPRLASQLNSLPNKLEGKYICAFGPQLWSDSGLFADSAGALSFGLKEARSGSTKFADKFADKHPGRSWDGAHPEPCWFGQVDLPRDCSSHCHC